MDLASDWRVKSPVRVSASTAWVADLQHASGAIGWVEIDPRAERGPFYMEVFAPEDVDVDPAHLAHQILSVDLADLLWVLVAISDSPGVDSLGWPRRFPEGCDRCLTFRAKALDSDPTT